MTRARLRQGACSAGSRWETMVHDFSARLRVHALRVFGNVRSRQQVALALDLLALLDALGIRSALLGGYDWGGRAACIIAALRPDRVRRLVSCSTPYNVQTLPWPANPPHPSGMNPRMRPNRSR